MENPKVTVLMPVYNGEEHLREAIESILNQTFANFEFLIINDGSTDSSASIIESYKDKRIRLINNEENLKLIRTLNKGLELAKGEYIARMDCDDISLPHRLEKQVAFMEANRDVGILGSAMLAFSTNQTIAVYTPEIFEEIKIELIFACPMIHPSVLMRCSVLKEHGLRYDINYTHAEDYKLWSEAVKHVKLHNLNDILIKYRLNPKGISIVHTKQQKDMSNKIRKENLYMLDFVLQEADQNILTSGISEKELLSAQASMDTMYLMSKIYGLSENEYLRNNLKKHFIEISKIAAKKYPHKLKLSNITKLLIFEELQSKLKFEIYSRWLRYGTMNRIVGRDKK